MSNPGYLPLPDSRLRVRANELPGMNYLHQIIRYPGIYLAISALLVLLAMAVVASLTNHNIEAGRETPLVKALGNYASTLEESGGQETGSGEVAA